MKNNLMFRMPTLFCFVFTPMIALLAGDPPESKLYLGLKAVLGVFGELRDQYTSMIVDPAARAQSRRSLRELSARLDHLARDKQEFTEQLRSAAFPRDEPRIRKQISELRQRVLEIKSSLGDVFAPLPDTWQKRAGEAQEDLQEPLNEKTTKLDQIARALNIPNSTLANIESESQHLVALVREMRRQVDGLIQDLTKPN